MSSWPIWLALPFLFVVIGGGALVLGVVVKTIWYARLSPKQREVVDAIHRRDETERSESWQRNPK